MNKTALIATAALVSGAALATYLKIHSNIIVKRFPDIDPKVARKANSMMVKRALAGAYNEMDDSDETMDKIFLAIVRELTDSK